MAGADEEVQHQLDRAQLERRRQMRFLILLAVAVLAGSVLHAGAGRVLSQGWWRLW